MNLAKEHRQKNNQQVLFSKFFLPKSFRNVQALCLHLDPGDGLLGLHHPRGLGGLALAHQLGGAQVAGAKQDTLYQNLRVCHRT